MERRNYDRDDISQAGRPIHTYTPRSHEELIKSHLNLDDAKKAKLQNELGRLAADNDRLRKDLERANDDLRNKDDDIRSLNNKLREKSRTPTTPADRYADPLYEVDGVKLNVDGVIDHFNVIIQRHHDLINRKNQQIQELQDALNNQPILETPPKRDAFVQPSKENDINRKMMADFNDQMARVREEYQQAENKLIDRNNRLMNMIEDLQRKLTDYQNEIQLLRQEISKTPRRSESAEQLLRDKNKEIANLQNLIEQLKKKTDDEDDDLRKLIENKKDAINKVNKMVDDVNSSKDPASVDLADVEKDCKTMIDDLNNMNSKLNNILNKLKDSPEPLEGEPLDKKDLIGNLENIKNQCQNEIVILENKIHPVVQKSASDIPIRDYTYTEPVRYEPYPQPEGTPPIKVVQSPYLGTPVKSNIYPKVPCEACSTPYLPQDARYSQESTTYLPQNTRAPPADKKLIDELTYKPTRPRSRSPDKPKKSKGGCCGKKASDSSNTPYEKEKVMRVHDPPRETGPPYKIGMGSRMGNAHYQNRYDDGKKYV